MASAKIAAATMKNAVPSEIPVIHEKILKRRLFNDRLGDGESIYL